VRSWTQLNLCPGGWHTASVLGGEHEVERVYTVMSERAAARRAQAEGATDRDGGEVSSTRRSQLSRAAV